MNITDRTDPNFGRLIRCECKAKEDAERLQVAIGTHLQNVALLEIQTGSRPGTEKMVQSAYQFICTPTGWLTIWGKNGNGKSTTGQAIVNELLAKNVPALYMTAVEAMVYLQNGIGDNDFNVEDRMCRLVAVQVLVMDEIAVKDWTKWSSEKLEELLDQRYRSDWGGTVLIMDVDPASFLSNRLVSRIEEGVVVYNGDPDMRKVIGQAKGEPCA